MADHVAAPTVSAAGRHETRLKRGALRPIDVIVLGMATVGPSATMILFTPASASLAGVSFPFAYLLAGLIAGIAAFSISELARKVPSAGGFVAFVSKAFGSGAGIMTAWIVFASYAIIEYGQYAWLGAFSHDVISARADIGIPWWVISLVAAITIFTLSIVGISQSARTGLVFLIFELAVITIVALVILAKGGDSGWTGAAFNPANSTFSGFWKAMAFAVFSFVGFESAVTFSEEAREGRRGVARAVLILFGIVLAFYLLVTYSQVVGYGPDHIDKLAGDAAPMDTLARRYVGSGMGVVIDVAVISSLIALIIGTHNAIVRIFYAMGRAGVLPRALGWTHRRFRTPWVAICFQEAVAVIAFLVFGAKFGPLQFFFYLATIVSLAWILLYVAMNVAVIGLYTRFYRAELNWVKHILVPMIGIGILVLPVIVQFYPVPASPYKWFPYAIIAWLALGLAVVMFVRARRPALLAEAERSLTTETEEPPGAATA